MGALDLPRTDSPVARESLRVVGWALFLHSAVGHVDVLIDGRAVGRARLGLPRPKVRADPVAGGHPAASVCGFEWIPGPSDLPEDRDRIRLEARATSVEGETFGLSLGGEVVLEPPEPPFEDRDGYALRRRRSTERLLGSRTPPTGEGTRVLAFTHRLDHGGAQRYFFEQIRYLLRDPSISCTVVAPTDGVWRRRLETIGADVHLTELPATGVAEYESAVAQLAAWANGQDFDVVFANTLDTFLGADLGARLGLPVAWSIHESFSVPSWWLAAHGRDGHAYVRKRLEHTLGQASALIFAADATRRLYEPYADPARMVTAPYGIELGDIDVFRREFDPSRARRRRAAFPEDALLLLCLGTINARKAQAVLVQAFGLVARRNRSAHLVLVGDTGDRYSDGIRTFLAEAGLEERCTLVPVTSDPYSWHEVADAFVLSSDIESSPISILEAMAFETPVVASNVFGVPELIEDGRHGYLCQASDIADLARCLDRLLSADPAERRRVARAGAERVRRRHDPGRYARSLRRLLIELSEDPAARPSWEPEPEGPALDAVDLEAAHVANGGPAAGGAGDGGDAKPWPTVRGELRALIRAAGRTERHVVDAGELDSLLGFGPMADPAVMDRVACLERVDFTGATVLEVGSRLGEVSRAVRALGAEIVDGVQFEQGLVTLAGLINAYRHTSRVSFHADLAELAARGEHYDVAIVSATVGSDEASRAAELAERALILELPGEQAQASALAAAIAPGFTFRTPLGEIESVVERATLLLLAREEEALADLLADGGDAISRAPVGGEVERA